MQFLAIQVVLTPAFWGGRGAHLGQGPCRMLEQRLFFFFVIVSRRASRAQLSEWDRGPRRQAAEGVLQIAYRLDLHASLVVSSSIQRGKV